MLKDVARKHGNKLYQLARENSKRNEDGITVVEKNDPWRNEDDDKPEKYRLSRRRVHAVAH